MSTPAKHSSGEYHGFFIPRIFILFSSRYARHLLRRAGEVQKFHTLFKRSRVLRMGRAGLRPDYDFVDGNRLHGGSDYRAFRRKQGYTKAVSYNQRRYEFKPARRVQIFGIRNRQY